MEVGEIRELVRRSSRRWARRAGTLAGVLAVAGAIGWSVRQDRMAREALDRAARAETAAANAQSAVEIARNQLRGKAPLEPALRRTRHQDPQQIQRVEQLYQEIDVLSQARDRVDQNLRKDAPLVPRRK